MTYVLIGIIACAYAAWLALELKNAPDDPNEKKIYEVELRRKIDAETNY